MKISGIKSYNLQTQANRPDTEGANKNKKQKNVKNLGIAAMSVASTVLPILMIRKYQGKTLSKDALQKLPFKEKAKKVWDSFGIDYGFKEVMLVCMSPILGGVTGGVIFDKETNPKEKVKEGIHKVLAQAIPSVMVSGLALLAGKAKVKTPIKEIASVGLGVGLGMPIANKVSNTLNKNVFKEKDYEERKIKPTDYLMHTDDIVSAMVLARVPFVNKLQLDKVLGLIFAHEGFEAGIAKKNQEKK